MTPAVRALEAAGVSFTVHEYQHDPSARGYGIEAAEALGLDPDQVFKTLLVTADGEPAVAIVPVSGQLSLKAVGTALGRKRVEMCDPAVAQRVTGYVVGGISPFGQRTLLPTVIDETCVLHDTVYVSGGRRGLDVGVAPDDLVRVLAAAVAEHRDKLVGMTAALRVMIASLLVAACDSSDPSAAVTTLSAEGSAAAAAAAQQVGLGDTELADCVGAALTSAERGSVPPSEIDDITDAVDDCGDLIAQYRATSDEPDSRSITCLVEHYTDRDLAEFLVVSYLGGQPSDELQAATQELDACESVLTAPPTTA